MDMRFYQICFSNDNGWHAFNYSENTPADAIKAFESIQNHYIGVGDALSRESVINYFVDSGFVFIAKMIYGYSDRFGRACHFAQAFCFPQSEIMTDPDYITGVSDENFTIQPTQDMDESIAATKEPPEKLILQKPAALKMSAETQKLFIYSLYKALTTIKKLGIVCDGQSVSAKGVLAAMLKILPQTLCKQFSLTTFKKPISEKFVLCTPENAVAKNVDLVRSTCSFLEQSDLDDLGKYPFTNCYTGTAADKEYLQKFDACLAQLGFSEALKLNHLKIADFFLSVEPDASGSIPALRQKSFSELSAYLELLLSFEFKRTAFSDLKTAQFIDYLLKFHADKIDESTYEKIVAYAADSEEELLKELAISCIVRIIVGRFGKVSTVSQKDYLRSLSLSPESFARIQKELQATRSEGREIIDLYYLDELKAVGSEKEAVLAFRQKITNTALYPKTVRYFEQQIVLLYADRFSVQSDAANAQLKTDLEEICQPLSDDTMAERCFVAVRTHYWTTFSPDRFDWAGLEVAESARSDDAACEALLHVISVVTAIRNYNGMDDRLTIVGFLDDLAVRSKWDELVSAFGKSGLGYIAISVICKECARSARFKAYATMLEVKFVAFLFHNTEKTAEYVATVGFRCFSDIRYEKDPLFDPESRDDLDALLEVLDQYDGAEKKAVNALKSDLKAACKAQRKDQAKKKKASEDASDEDAEPAARKKGEKPGLFSFLKKK